MKISKEFDAIVGFAREEAMRTGSYSIEADHLFLGILRHGGNAAVEATPRWRLCALRASIPPGAKAKSIPSFSGRKASPTAMRTRYVWAGKGATPSAWR